MMTSDDHATVDVLSKGCNPRGGKIVMTDEDVPDALIRKR